MFFYDFNNLDTFINNNITKSLMDEIKHIENTIALYQEKKINLSNIISDMTSSYNSLLKNCLEDLENINNYSKTLRNNLETILSLCKTKEMKQNTLINNEIKANLVEYNKQAEKLQKLILDYEKDITHILNSTIHSTFSSDLSSTTKCENFYINSDNPILLVSEKKQKAYLPYRYIDIVKIYKNSKDKYSCIEDVVEKLYIIPLNRFKNSSLSRFREAYQLIKNKEKGSSIKALDLGLELMFNYDLNPIIIAACRNLDELDIYLDCLKSNELSDFDCFEIKFEIAPQISKESPKNFSIFGNS